MSVMDCGLGNSRKPPIARNSSRDCQLRKIAARSPPSHFLGHKSSQSPSVEESLPRTQEQPVTLRRSTQEHPVTLGEEDPGAASPPRRKKTQEHPDTIVTRDLPCSLSKAEMGRRQCKSTYNNMKNKTSPESSPPPTPRPEHCNVDKAEENDLKNSLMKMIEEALEGKMKNAIKEIEEKTNKKLEEMNKEIEDKNKKMEEKDKEIEKTNKKLEEINKEIEEKTNKKWKKRLKKL
ncbi:hypothetical protein STEG23_018079 [Scotinomys teguina]